MKNYNPIINNPNLKIMKKLLSSALLLLAICSCNENLGLDLENAAVPSTRAFAVETFSFDSITRPEVWSTYQSLEEMQRACQVPDSILVTLTTEDLVKLCMDYPLYGIYTAYNNEQDGIRVIMDGFNGFGELKKRKDASKALVDCYEAFDADKMVAVMAADVDFNSDLNPLKLGYLELLLSTDEISSMLDAEDVARLEKVRIEQLRKQEALPEFFGEKMLHRTRRLGTKFALENDASTRSSGSVIVTTKCGKEVQGLLREEMSDYEMGYWDGYYDASFPNAVRVETSSNMYNCHGYAWCKSDGGITCWINAESGNSNIEKYWTRDYYVSTTEANAVKVNYPDSDHSAINLGNGMYKSKWGSCPLMKHAPDYGPYPNMNIRNYYRHDNINRQLVCSGGNGEQEVGKTYSYSIPFDKNQIPTGSKVRCEWTIENAKGEEAIGNEADLTETDTGVAQIRISRQGYYDIYYNVYVDKGEKIISCYFQAVVIN